MTIVSTPVQNRSAKGKASVKGKAPNMEIKIMGLRPMRSVSAPPSTVPTAIEAMKMNNWIWAAWMERLNLSIR